MQTTFKVFDVKIKMFKNMNDGCRAAGADGLGAGISMLILA